MGAWLGYAQTALPPACSEIREVLQRLTHELFVAQAQLARDPGAPPKGPAITSRHVDRLEHDIDAFQERHPVPHHFVVPGGSTAAALLHLARTVSRRAERELVALDRESPVAPALTAWANRLSDLLFALAVSANRTLGVAETAPNYDV